MMTLHLGGSSSPKRSPCLVASCKREEGWVQRNYYVTYRPSQRHGFHCHFTSPSGGGSSRVHGSTTCRVSVLSRLRRQRRRSLLSFVPKVSYSIGQVDQYSRLDNVPDVPSQYNDVHSVYILYVFG